jgi:hypothetical protein
MSTTRFPARVYSCSTDTIVLKMSAPYIADDFFLSQIIIYLNSGITGFSGCWQPGNPQHGGSRTIEAGTTEFNRLYNECIGATTVTATLTYHDGGSSGYCIDCIDCPQPTIHSALIALNQISSQLGTGSVTAEIRRSNEIALAQLKVQEQILQLLQAAQHVPPPPPPGQPGEPGPGHNHEHHDPNGRERAQA